MADVYGLRIKHPVTGAVLLEITDSITRVLGQFTTTGTTGSVTIPAGLGRGFFHGITGNQFGSVYATPAVTISGNSLSWNYGSTPVASRVPMVFVYGVY